MKSRYHIVIAGSGIGGLSAAWTLSGHGLDILVVDENVHPGGQLLRGSRQGPSLSSKRVPDQMKSAGFDLIRKVRKRKEVDWLFQTQILGVFEEKKLLLHVKDPDILKNRRCKRIIEIQAESIIFATGARERYLPFKGWTLPGVMSLGAAQILMKSHGVLPARFTLIAGSSPLMMVLASEIISNKGQVAGFFDENTWTKKAAFLPLAYRHWKKLSEGARHGLKMLLNRTPVYRGYRVLEARGMNEFEYAIVAKTSADGSVIEGTEKKIFARALCTGYGFVPNIELPTQAGCQIEFDDNQGGWIVKANNRCESTLDSVFVVGELTGISGAIKSYLQGETAALAILKNFGKAGIGKDKIKYHQKMDRLAGQIREEKKYAAFLNRFCQIPDSAYRAIPDDTIICRCEGITMGVLKKAVQQGFETIGSIKKATRAGMGRCQGRICSHIIVDIISALTLKEPMTAGHSISRTPVKNVSIQAFLDLY